MNTFIKRSMKLAVAIVFIGASVVPACAQNKKGIIKGAKAALGKKPPMTGTAPVVKPVTPRVPPTLQGAAMPNVTAAVNNALDNAVERTVAKTTYTPIPVDYSRDVMDSFIEIAGNNHVPNSGWLDIAWILKIFELTDEAVFLKTGEFIRYDLPTFTYKEIWFHIKKEICDDKDLSIYLNGNSVLEHVFELRQQQKDRLLHSNER